MEVAAHSKNLTKGALVNTRLRVELGVKECTTCGSVKSLDEFALARNSLGGVASACKDCLRKYHRERNRKMSADVMFRVNKGILHRQHHGTNVCWLSDARAHRATSHLLDELGFIRPEHKGAFKSLLSRNTEARMRREVDKAKLRADAKVRRSELVEQQRQIRHIEKLARRAEPRSSDVETINDAVVDEAIYQRLRYHLKKQRRLGRTHFSFTKANFVVVAGYSIPDIRTHLNLQMPMGHTWSDVVRGEIHIEHVIPAAAFDLTALYGVRRCYAMSNLTLLHAAANAKKGASSDKDTVAHFARNPDMAVLFGLKE